jgi:hypothetical protein
LKLPQAVGVEVRTPGKVRAEHRDLEDVGIRGVTANIADMDIQEVASGRYVSESDNQHHAMAAVLGAEVVDKLFPNRDPLDTTPSPYESGLISRALKAAPGRAYFTRAVREARKVVPLVELGNVVVRKGDVPEVLRRGQTEILHRV